MGLMISKEIKEILIDLVDYWNTMGTESDPGFEVIASITQRASKVLEQDTKENLTDKKSADVDPFGITDEFPIYKLEDEW